MVTFFLVSLQRVEYKTRYLVIRRTKAADISLFLWCVVGGVYRRNRHDSFGYYAGSEPCQRMARWWLLQQIREQSVQRERSISARNPPHGENSSDLRDGRLSPGYLGSYVGKWSRPIQSCWRFYLFLAEGIHCCCRCSETVMNLYGNVVQTMTLRFLVWDATESKWNFWPGLKLPWFCLSFCVCVCVTLEDAAFQDKIINHVINV